MAKGKRTRSARSTESAIFPKLSSYNSSCIELSQEAIDRHWDVLPPQARNFITDSADGMFPLWKLIKFWSSPRHIDSTRGNFAGTICGAAWYLALVYIRLRNFKMARALTINGSFIHQCYNTSIEYITNTLCKYGNLIPEYKLSYFFRGLESIRSPDMMESFIKSYLPEEYTHMMTSFANTSSRRHVMDYIDRISDDWKGNSSASRNAHHRALRTHDGTQIKLILVDDVNEGDRQSLNIDSSTTLKALFNEYADKRGISLRLLHFSYKAKSLFLSSAGHKTPEELGMQDQDVIMVHDTSRPQQPGNDNSPTQQTNNAKKTRAKKRSSKKAKGKSKEQKHYEKHSKTLEEYKIEHSKQLTKLHGEADARFKQIRQQLNNLVIERSQPKTKSKRSCTLKSVPSLTTSVLKSSHKGLGGKAGKSHYDIQVGEVQNLYKTTKPTHSSSSTAKLLTLDLHGCTREEAVMKLDESLKVWVDTAMQGSYPFVQPATIVCGCGNQILSETVQDWIRSNDKVSNAPKGRFFKRREYVSRAA